MENVLYEEYKNQLRPRGFEPLTPCFEDKYSIQLSYGRFVY